MTSGLRPLFVLLRMGFARPARYRAAGGLLPPPFHPYRPLAGGLFLLHSPSGCPARVLPGILARRSPDFPLRLREATARPPEHRNQVYRPCAVIPFLNAALDA
jgi:hypothetical protein